MRSIGQLSDERQAKRFSDFLLTQGIRNEVEADGPGVWSVWVLDDEQLVAGQSWLERFQRDPAAAEFAQAATADEVRAREQREQAEWRQRVHNRRRVFPGSTTYSPGLITCLMIFASVTVAMLSSFGENEEFLQPLMISFGLPGRGFLAEVLAGDVWRLVTPMFIHFSAAHLIFNMMWLFRLGSMVESLQGIQTFVLLVIAFNLSANLPQYFFVGPNFGGMSGVNYGLIGYVWFRGKFDPASGLHLDKQNVVLAVAFFFLCFTGWVGPVANHAHAGGFILGLAWGWLSARLALRQG